ncbi:MAG: HlyD family type I secretion periplasmic adaptor subunit [Burkholderiaceae bacterium]|nr:HlyD family type I secretion periplasmic adaptor subunit [Burkholderiaceae bacterium]
MPVHPDLTISAPSPELPPPSAKVIALRLPTRWHDPLKLIQDEAPSHIHRIVLHSVAALVLALLTWALFGKLDIIATAEGKLVPRTLIKVVQPAEAGIIKELLVHEGDPVKSGQVLARLDTTLASADRTGVAADMATQLMQVRRLEAALNDRPMVQKNGDSPQLYAQINAQYASNSKAYLDSLAQEQALLSKLEHERRGAIEVQRKLEQTLPTYTRIADSYAKLEKEGFMGSLVATDKAREAIEKSKDLDAQKSAVEALSSGLLAQQKKVSQLQSSYKSELQKELAEVRIKITQLQPNLDKTQYREGLMELRAPQDGVVKDLATTTIGAVVQPGSVVLTLVPQGEQLFADINIKNEDIGFVRVNQTAHIKLATYPFQQYGMLTGTVIHLSQDATETVSSNEAQRKPGRSGEDTSATAPPASSATYKARIRLETQTLKAPDGTILLLTPGMQVSAEINQGSRTVMQYLLSPLRKAIMETGRER